MSAIQKELEKLDIKQKRNEERDVFLRRAAKEISELPDAEYDELTKATQDWGNLAIDAINAKAKTLDDFPDLETEKEEKTTRRRSSAAADEPKVVEPAVGLTVKVVTKRGKEVTGEVIELTKDTIVIKDGKDEEEFDLDRVTSVTVVGGAAEEDAAEYEPKEGDTVKVTTKRGKEYTGEIIELTKKIIAIKTDDGEEEFDLDRVGSIELVGGKPAKEEPTSSRRRTTAAAKDEGGDDKKTRSSNPGGVSVGKRIMELIAEDLDATIEEIDKQLTKEGLEYKPASLKMNYTDNHKFIAILRAAKKLKG